MSLSGQRQAFQIIGSGYDLVAVAAQVKLHHFDRMRVILYILTLLATLAVVAEMELSMSVTPKRAG